MLLSDAGALTAAAPEFILGVKVLASVPPHLAGFCLRFSTQASLLAASWERILALWSWGLHVQKSSPRRCWGVLLLRLLEELFWFRSIGNNLEYCSQLGFVPQWYLRMLPEWKTLSFEVVLC